ncbi:MAG: hypothetical protein KatS3mg131_1023 [Candidatus Tectimicrobiota bacterium]|nr:MAG: hypothetical protein KatS3mg131_1023 [Candidatus Tectomicrobia bacterium]
MDKASNGGRQRKSQALHLGPTQVGLALGFIALALVAAFGLGVLVGMWYQASDVAVPLPATAVANGKAAEHGEPAVTFYTTLAADQPPEPALASPAGPAATAAQEPAPPAPAPAAPPASPRQAPTEARLARPPVATAYSVQVGSFRARDQAETLKQRLSDKGYTPRVQLVHVPGKGLWYRVRVGEFAERTAAQQLAQRLARQEQLPALVISVTP